MDTKKNLIKTDTIQLNKRPRKTLGYNTPEKVILYDVALTG